MNTLPGSSGYGTLAFGDTDHDGKGEVLFLHKLGSGVFRYEIYEHQGSNTYTLESSVDANIIPYATGDLDQDGRTELVAQYSYWLQVHESPDATSYPTTLVWSSPPLSNFVGRATTGDTDLDGRMEIIYSVNTGGSGAISIFENDGDNSFIQVYFSSFAGGAISEKATGDLDGDGLPEIAFAGNEGLVYVLESCGDNCWLVRWSTDTGLNNCYAVEIGTDLDRNGRSELFVEGSSLDGWTTRVYESDGSSGFSLVASWIHNDGYGGHPYNAIGNFTGTGQLEYVMQGQCCAWFYVADGPGQWELISTLSNDPDHWHFGLFGVDVNANGRSELFWTGAGLTSILEHSGWVSDTSERNPGLARIHVSPNPARDEAILRLSGDIAGATRLAVYDVAGRLVRAWSVNSGDTPVIWRTGTASAGVYFVNLENEDGTRVSDGRLSVIR